MHTLRTAFLSAQVRIEVSVVLPDYRDGILRRGLHFRKLTCRTLQL